MKKQKALIEKLKKKREEDPDDKKALIESNSNFEVSSGACPVSGISRLITFSFACIFLNVDSDKS